MALVEIVQNVVKVGVDPHLQLSAVDGADVFIQLSGGGAAALFADQAGTVPITSPVVSDSGRVTAWTEEGQYLRFRAVLPGVLDPAAPWEYFHSSGPSGPTGPPGPDTAAALAGLPFVSILAYTGTFDAMLTSAKAAVGANGGTISIPKGTYASAAPPSFQGTRSVTLKGAGGTSAGATCATQIVYSGTATRPIDARASYGFHMEDIQFLYSNASFTGAVVDFIGSAFGAIQRCQIGGIGTRSAAALMDLDQTQGMSFRDTVFSGAARAVRGMASGSWANVVSFDSCTFKDLTAMAVQELGESWTFRSCIFQNLVTSGGVIAGAGGISSTVAGVSTLSPKGVTVIGCWFGDAAAVGTWILVKGTGWYIAGNSIGGGSIGIDTRSTNTQGVTIIGNRFDVVANAVAMGAQKNLVVLGNDWSNCTLGAVYAAIPTGSLVQDQAIGGASHIQNYGGLLTVPGPVSDASFGATPPNGTMGLDSTNSRLYVRVGGTWKYAALT